MYNRVTLIGNVVQDVELRTTPNGNSVATLRIASNRRYKSGDDLKEETVYVDVEAWGNNAEVANKYLAKGKPVLIEGRLSQDTWEDKETKAKRSKIYVTAEQLRLLPKNGGGESSSSEEPEREEATASSGGPKKDDIPF